MHVYTLSKATGSIPSGVQYGYSISALTGAGWKYWYNSPYSHRTTTSNIQPNQGVWILWGSKYGSSATTLSLGAFGRRSIIQGQSGVWENGVYWYTQDGLANGFAGTSSIYLNSADVTSSESSTRLSWHLGGSNGGYRSGSTLSLNGDNTWYKVVMYLEARYAYLGICQCPHPFSPATMFA